MEVRGLHVGGQCELHVIQNTCHNLTLTLYELLLKAQTPTVLEAYDVIADSLLENALYFFRDRIENAGKRPRG